MKHIQIELTNSCNLRCVECPHRFMKRKTKHMDQDTFDGVLKFMSKQNWETIIMHKDGEPLLHPNIKSLIERFCTEHHTKMDLYTNGTLLSEEFIQFLGKFDKSMFSVLVSFHFFASDGSHINCKDVDNTLMACIKNAPSNVKFILVTHATDMVTDTFLDKWHSNWNSVQLENSKVLQAVHVNKAINPWGGLIHQKNNIKFSGCPYTDGAHFFVGVTGNILACCMDLEEEMTFGTIFKPDLLKLEQHYDSLAKGIVRESMCKRCMGIL